jgi:hypothetical protein
MTYKTLNRFMKSHPPAGGTAAASTDDTSSRDIVVD